MSIDYTANFDAPLVTTSLTPGDDGEFSLRPRTLADYTNNHVAFNFGNVPVASQGHNTRCGKL